MQPKKKIHYHTFRHWKATPLYHQTKDILFVMKFLGHRSIKNTLLYIDLEIACFSKGGDEYHAKTARTEADVLQLKQGLSTSAILETLKSLGNASKKKFYYLSQSTVKISQSARVGRPLFSARLLDAHSLPPLLFPHTLYQPYSQSSSC